MKHPKYLLWTDYICYYSKIVLYYYPAFCRIFYTYSYSFMIRLDLSWPMETSGPCDPRVYMLLFLT